MTIELAGTVRIFFMENICEFESKTKLSIGKTTMKFGVRLEIENKIYTGSKFVFLVCYIFS